jgi:glutaryl-CoA dehydrogenase
MLASLFWTSRIRVAWEAVGHAIAAYEIARDYALARHQFGKPIASFQGAGDAHLRRDMRDRAP